MGLKALVCLKFASSTWKIAPVRDSTNSGLQRHFDCIAAEVCGAIEAARCEKCLRVLKTRGGDIVEFGNGDHRYQDYFFSPFPDCNDTKYASKSAASCAVTSLSTSSGIIEIRCSLMLA